MCIVMEEEFKGLDTGTQFKRGVLNIFEVPVGSFFLGGGGGGGGEAVTLYEM